MVMGPLGACNNSNSKVVSLLNTAEQVMTLVRPTELHEPPLADVMHVLMVEDRWFILDGAKSETCSLSLPLREAGNGCTREDKIRCGGLVGDIMSHQIDYPR